MVVLFPLPSNLSSSAAPPPYVLPPLPNCPSFILSSSFLRARLCMPCLDCSSRPSSFCFAPLLACALPYPFRIPTLALCSFLPAPCLFFQFTFLPQMRQYGLCVSSKVPAVEKGMCEKEFLALKSCIQNAAKTK